MGETYGVVNRNAMRVALYPRVSTLEQAKDGYSINEQTERMIKYCEAKGWVVHKIYTDAGYSGADTDRPGLQSLIKDAESNKVNAVLVYKLDRLSRSQKDTLTLIEDVFLPNNVDFISMTENLDTSTPFGRAMIGILSVFAQLEREQIKERMEVGKIGRAKEGKWCGSRYVPIGYRVENDELVVHEYEAMQIREMFRLFNMRISQRRVAEMLQSKGYRTTYDGNWNRHNIRPLLENKHYIGMVSYKGEWYEGIHKPIIDKETFEKTQAILAERDEDANSRISRINAPLAGMIRCGHCGNKFFFRRAKTKNSAKLYCNCYKRSCRAGKWKDIPKEERCKNKIWKAEELEKEVFDEVRKLALHPESFDVSSTESDENAMKIKVISKRIEEIDSQLDKLIDLYTLGTLDINVIKSRTDTLLAEKEKLEVNMRSLENKEKMSKEEAVEIASSLCDVIDSGDIDEIKALVQELIKEIVVDEEDLHVYWKFA